MMMTRKNLSTVNQPPPRHNDVNLVTRSLHDLNFSTFDLPFLRHGNYTEGVESGRTDSRPELPAALLSRKCGFHRHTLFTDGLAFFVRTSCSFAITLHRKSIN